MPIRERIASLLGVESRAQGYTATIQQAVARAIRDPGASAASTAAVEFGYGLLARAFAVASVSPSIPALDAQYRAGMILDLLSRGNHVAVLVVQGGEMSLHRVGHYDVNGGYDPRSWRYTMTLTGPTATATMEARRDQVVHVRVGASADRPWAGVSPLAAAGVSADILALAETGLRREMQAHHIALVQHPASYLPNEAARADFARALSDSERQLLVEAGNEGWRQQRPAGAWQQVRLGPQPDANELTLREQVGQEVLSAMGIPPGLYVPREGAVSREAYRQLLSACIEPYAALCTEELSRVLERPVRLGFHRLAAADVAARARAFGSLVQAGVMPESAAVIAGIEEAEMSPPEPETETAHGALPGAQPGAQA